MNHPNIRVSVGLSLVIAASGCYASHGLPERAGDAGVLQDAADRIDAADAAREDAGPPFQADLTALVEAYCRRFEQCAGPGLPPFGDCVDFTTTVLFSVVAPLWKEGLVDGSLEYHPERIASCIETFPAASCEDFLTSQTFCDIFTGRRRPGEPCRDDQECAADAYCPTTSSCDATCVATAGEGEACDPTYCQSGLVCDDFVCVPAGSIVSCRSPYRPARSDGTGFACIGDSATEDGVRRPGVEAFRLPIGAVCDLEFGDLCSPPAICGRVAGRAGVDAVYRCEVPYERSGPCHSGVPDGCPSDQYCEIDPFGFGEEPGVCTDLPGVGFPCVRPENAARGRCALGLTCSRAEVCARRANPGEACDIAEDCVTYNCEAGVCVVPACLTLS